MRLPAAYLKLHNHLALTLAKRKLVTVPATVPGQGGRALLYYKTDPFTRGYLHDHRHTNIWMIRAIVNILNRLSFTVDVLDRSGGAEFTARHSYRLFIGLGSDDSGQHFPRIAAQLPGAVKIMHATCTEPTARNEAVLERYQNFAARRGRQLVPQRLARRVDIAAVMQCTDYIFYIGNDSTRATYEQHNKPLLRIAPSTTPKLSITARSFNPVRKSRFLFFSGTGNILKGLDLALEAFAGLPHLNLYVCTSIEPEIARHYEPLLKQSSNIHIEEVVNPLGSRFQELTNRCGYILLPSASEGAATSVATCMRRGLVPVVTPACGIDIESFGQEIIAGTVPAVRKACLAAASRSAAQFRTAVRQSYAASFAYTQEAFIASFTDALLQVCEQEHIPLQPPLMPARHSK